MVENNFTDEQKQAAVKGIVIGAALGLGTGLIMNNFLLGTLVGVGFTLAIGGGMLALANKHR